MFRWCWREPRGRTWKTLSPDWIGLGEWGVLDLGVRRETDVFIRFMENLMKRRTSVQIFVKNGVVDFEVGNEMIV